MHLSVCDVVNERCSVECVVSGNVTSCQHQTSVVTLSVAESDDRLAGEEVGQGGC